MRVFLKKYSAAACALLCVLILAGAWTFARTAADAGTYRLDDVEGSRAYLNGIRVDMQLADAAHTQHIKLVDGALSHSYEYTIPFLTSPESSYSTYQSFVEAKNANVEVQTSTNLTESGENYELWTTRLTRTADTAQVSVAINSEECWIQVVTDITVSNTSHPFVFSLESESTVDKGQTTAQGEPLPDTTSQTPFSYVYSEELNSGYEAESGYNQPLFAEAADGTVYFTPALRPYHGGTSAIYCIDAWGSYEYSEESSMVDGYLCYSDDNAMAVGSVSVVASFPTEELYTVALNVVNDKLCLLLIADGMLTLRVYSLDGTMQYEIPLFLMDFGQGINSTLFSNESGGTTMLCYYVQDGSVHSNLNEPKFQPVLFCIRLSENAELISTINPKSMVTRATFIGDRWVLAETEYLDVPFSLIFERNFISVLDVSGATLYRGEVVTDAYQDEIQNYISFDTGRPEEYTVSRWLVVESILEE